DVNEAGTAFTEELARGDPFTGRFQVDVALASPGTATVVAHVEGATGQPGPPSAPATVTYDPTLIATPGGVVSRCLTVTLAPAGTVDGRSIHVTARGSAPFRGTALTDAVELNDLGGGFPDDVHDSFTLRVSGYCFASLSPAPSLLSPGAATWNGPVAPARDI